MSPIFQYQQLAQLWLSLKAMKSTDDVFRHLDDYFKHDTTIEGTITHNNIQTYYLASYTLQEKRLQLTFAMSARPTPPGRTAKTTPPSAKVLHITVDITPDNFYTALQSVEQFMSLFY